MRLTALGFAGALAAAQGPAAAQNLTGGVDAWVCVFASSDQGTGPELIVLGPGPDGQSRVLSPWPGAEIIRDDGSERLLLREGLDVLHIAGDASALISANGVVEATCNDVRAELRSLIEDAFEASLAANPEAHTVRTLAAIAEVEARARAEITQVQAEADEAIQAAEARMAEAVRAAESSAQVSLSAAEAGAASARGALEAVRRRNSELGQQIESLSEELATCRNGVQRVADDLPAISSDDPQRRATQIAGWRQLALQECGLPN